MEFKRARIAANDTGDGVTCGNYRFSMAIEHDIEKIRHCKPQLETLARRASEPNVFAEPWMLFPALESYADGHRLAFLLLYATRRDTGDVMMCGFVPLETRTRYRGLPLRHVALWTYPHCYLSTPLLHREFTVESLKLLIDWFVGSRGLHLMILNQVSAGGPFCQALEQVLAGSRVRVFEKAFTRAFFHPGKDIKSYLAEAMSKSTIQNHNRLRRRLSETGAMTWATLATGEDPGAWIDAFLELEASGWKGASGTALQKAPEDRRFFRRAAGNACERHRLLMIALRVDKKPIAMVVVFLAEDGGFAFKMAYRESHARYSPGALVLLELNRQLHLREGFKWLDSCANPASSIPNRVWKDRKHLSNFTIAKSRSPAAILVKLLPFMSHIKSKLAA